MNHWMRGGLVALVLGAATAATALVATHDARAQVPVIEGKGRLIDFVNFYLQSSVVTPENYVDNEVRRVVLTVPEDERFFLTDAVLANLGNEFESTLLIERDGETVGAFTVSDHETTNHSYSTALVFEGGEEVAVRVWPHFGTCVQINGYTVRARARGPDTLAIAPDEPVDEMDVVLELEFADR